MPKLFKKERGFTLHHSVNIRKYISQNRQNGEGFTIIELVIAIFILSVAIFGVYNAFSTIVVLTSGISDRLTAAYLAQEGIEIIRNIRDTNWIEMGTDPNITWYDGLSGWEDGCEADYTTGTAITNPTALAPWAGSEPSGSNEGGGNYLKLNTNGFYVYGTGSDTKFKRKIIIEPPGGSNDYSNGYIMKVSVEVFWSEKGEWSQIEAEDNLYDWY